MFFLGDMSWKAKASLTWLTGSVYWRNTNMFYIFSIQLLFLCLFVIFGYTIGRVLLRNFNFSSLVEGVSFSILFGWSILAFILMFLGFLGCLQAFNLFIVSAVELKIGIILFVRGATARNPSSQSKMGQ